MKVIVSYKRLNCSSIVVQFIVVFHDEIEKICQFNQNTRALLRMRHFRESTSTSETDSTSVTTSTKQDLNVSKESQHDKKEAAKESTSTSEIDSSDHFLV